MLHVTHLLHILYWTKSWTLRTFSANQKFSINFLAVKKLEHAWKALLYDGDTVSVHRPSFYSERFERFMFGKVFVSLPMTESLRRLNAQNKQRPKLKKTPEEEIKNIEEISVEEIVLPSNEQLTNEILPSNEQNKAESADANQELAVPELEPSVIEPEPSVTEMEATDTETKQAVTDEQAVEKTSNEIIADNNDLQKESSLQIVTNVVTTPVTVPNQTETDCDIGTVSDEGDAKQKDQLLSRKIDTSSGMIFREKF